MSNKVDSVLVSYVLGIIAIIFAFVSPIAGLILGVVGYVHGRGDKNGKKARLLNFWAIIISIIFIIAGIALASYISSQNLGNFPL